MKEVFRIFCCLLQCDSTRVRKIGLFLEQLSLEIMYLENEDSCHKKRYGWGGKGH